MSFRSRSKAGELYEITLDGSFLFPVIREGLSRVTVAPTAGAYLDTVLTGVAVSPQQVTDLGPITLQPQP
jgi:hypothetical protein